MTPLRILIVDDERWKAAAIRRLLEADARRAGLVVRVTQLEAAEDLPADDDASIDAVISDWQMPGAGGASVVAWAAARELPVVVISGSDRPSTWRDSRVARWAESWEAGVRWILRRAATGRVQLEVTC